MSSNTEFTTFAIRIIHPKNTDTDKSFRYKVPPSIPEKVLIFERIESSYKGRLFINSSYNRIITIDDIKSGICNAHGVKLILLEGKDTTGQYINLEDKMVTERPIYLR